MKLFVIDKKMPDKLIFYKIMWYPIPAESSFFEFWSKKNNELTNTKNNWFSRNEKNIYMDNFINKINKYWKLYQSIPFISEIFLCNSITFNSLKEDSDIDIFIIAKNWALRRARFFSVLIFRILWLKRSKRNKKEKFCLSFYTIDNNKNLYQILLKDSTDIYLWYRLAHLVPLYQEKEDNDWMYSNNTRFKSLFQNHPQKYCINLWNNRFSWSTKLKAVLEFLNWWIFWKFIEFIIKTIRKPIMKIKKKKLWDKWKWIIINDNMLKFYEDKRKDISFKYTSIKNPYYS